MSVSWTPENIQHRVGTPLRLAPPFLLDPGFASLFKSLMTFNVLELFVLLD